MTAESRLNVRATRKKTVATITVNYTPAEADRGLYVVVESENVSESSFRQLEGAGNKQAQYRFEWRLPDDGIYVITAVIMDQMGKVIERAETKLLTMPRPEP